MSRMLLDSEADRHFMLRRHGFAILVFLLRQLPPVIWSVDAVTACVQLTSCFATSVRDLSRDACVHHEALWLLFGAPRLWIFTELSVQLKVYEVLQGAIELRPRAFLTPSPSGEPPLLSVQLLLDLLEVYYWHQPSAASFARQPLRHAVSGAIIGERPAADGLRKLRQRVLALLQVLAECELSRADAQCLVAVLRSCRDWRLLIDVLKLLMSWLSPLDARGGLPPCGKGLIARLTELAAEGEETMYDTLVDLMHGDSEVLRLAALRLLGKPLALVHGRLCRLHSNASCFSMEGHHALCTHNLSAHAHSSSPHNPPDRSDPRGCGRGPPAATRDLGACDSCPWLRALFAHDVHRAARHSRRTAAERDARSKRAARVTRLPRAAAAQCWSCCQTSPSSGRPLAPHLASAQHAGNRDVQLTHVAACAAAADRGLH